LIGYGREETPPAAKIQEKGLEGSVPHGGPLSYNGPVRPRKGRGDRIAKTQMLREEEIGTEVVICKKCGEQEKKSSVSKKRRGYQIKFRITRKRKKQAGKRGKEHRSVQDLDES